jgi:hypothetical protein
MPTKKATKKAPAKKPAAKKVAKKATKKVAKKAVKKTIKKTAKKTTKKASSKKELVYADGSTAFWVTNGQVLDSLVALRDALDAMEKAVYEYHAGGAHNDFANWVDAVLADAKCAKDLEKAKTAKSAKTVVVKHLKVYAV